jgi:glucosylceramidase
MKIIISNPGRLFEERIVDIAPPESIKGPIAEITCEQDQQILGFGAALTDSACVMLNRVDEKERNDLLKEIYSPDEGNFSISRLCVGASDYAEKVYNFAEVPNDMDMEHFDASHDDLNIIPVVKKAIEYNPDLYFFSSTWSPPGWMKTSSEMQGGWMVEKYVDAYALYYLKFLQHYLKSGIKI